MGTEPDRRALRQVVAATFGALLLCSCGPTLLDVSSPEALQESVAKLTEPMSEAELARFNEAVEYIVGDAAVIDLESTPIQSDFVLERYRPIAGRTAEGIVAEARYRRIKRVKRAVTELEFEREAATDARAELADFRFTAARVFKRHKKFLEWPVIEIKVANDTGHLITLVHFRAALLNDDDENPWLVEEFDHLALGGLAPGARDIWRIEPEQQEWIRLIDPHPDLKFTLEPMRLVARGGGVLCSADWGEVEAHKLKIYQRTLRKIRILGTLALDSPPLPLVDDAPGFTPSAAAGLDLVNAGGDGVLPGVSDREG
jgi:hypothetical protein